MGSDTGKLMAKKCLLCGSNDLSNFYEYNQVKLIQCRNCDLLFKENLQNGNLNEVLEKTYDENWVNMRQKYLKDTFIRHAGFNILLLEMFCTEKGDLLEIGSGTGEFLYMAQAAGWKITGVEPSAEACSFAQNHFRIQLIPRMWDKRALEEEGQFEKGKKFEAIVFWHVLEHIPDPVSFLQEMAVLLKSNGKIFFSIPNSKSFTNKIYGPHSLLFTEIDHLFHYNSVNLKLLLKKAGLKPVSLFSREEYQQMKTDLNAYLKMTNRPGEISIENAMSIIARLQAKNQGYELFCVAEKQE